MRSSIGKADAAPQKRQPAPCLRSSTRIRPLSSPPFIPEHCRKRPPRTQLDLAPKKRSGRWRLRQRAAMALAHIRRVDRAVDARPRTLSSQTPGPRVTDFQPAVRDNSDLIGATRSVFVSQDGPRSCPKPISALFDNLSPYSGIFYV